MGPFTVCQGSFTFCIWPYNQPHRRIFLGLPVAKSLNRINFPQAIAEVSLIAFGIIAAVGVQAWWEEKKDRDAEFAYLLSLQQDFIANHENFVDTIDSISMVFQNINTVFSILANSDASDLPDTFSETLGRAYFVYTTTPVTGTYDDMVNSGNLRLIESERLRNQLAQFITVVEQVRYAEQSQDQGFRTTQTPFINRYLITTDFGWFDEDADVDVELTEFVGSEPQPPHSVDTEAARSKEFWNTLYSWKSSYAVLIQQVIIARNLCDEILASLEVEIAKHSEE